jgi:hypothetical protein
MPWTDPRVASAPALRAGLPQLDLSADFWAHLTSAEYLGEVAATAKRRFQALDSEPELSAQGLFEINNTARLLALLDHLRSAARSRIASRHWDEYVCRIGGHGSGWHFRLAQALPYPASDRDAVLGRNDHGLLAAFSRYLQDTSPLAACDHRSVIVVPFEDLGQLPFVYRFALHAREVCPAASLELHDRCPGAPEVLRVFFDDLERVGYRVRFDDSEATEIGPQWTKALSEHARSGKRALRVTWRPSVASLAKGTSEARLTRYLRAHEIRKVPVALVAYIPLEPGNEDQEKALFAAFDALGRAQWSLSSLMVRMRRAHGAQAGTFEEWFAGWLEDSVLADMARAQVDAELDNHELAPHTARVRPLLGKGTKLQAAPRSTLRSRYPLDQLSDADPAILSWNYGYGRECGRPEVTLRAARRRQAYEICVGGRLIFSGAAERQLLDDLAEPRMAQSYLRGAGKRLGARISDLEALVEEGALEIPRLRAPRARQRPAARKGIGGYLHFVGTGPSGQESMDLRAVQAIRGAEELWIQDLGSPGLERTSIRKLLVGKKVINTVHYYGLGHLRSLNRGRFYELVGRRAVDMATKGRRITMVFSGSPVVWVQKYTVARQYATQNPDFDLRVTNALSFVDTVFVPTPLGCVHNLQLRLGSLTSPVEVSPEIDCVLGQVGDTGQPLGYGPQTVDQTLARLYPADHPIYVVGNDAIDAEPLYLETTASEISGIIAQYGRWNLCLVIPSLRRAAEVRELARREQERRCLDYFLGAK